MKIKHVLSSLFLAVFFGAVSACADLKPTPEVMPATTVTPAASQTPIPTIVLPTATLTTVMTKWANDACWEETPYNDASTDFSGSLFYRDSKSAEYRILDLKTDTTRGINLFGNFFTLIQVSPGGRYFSTLRSTDNEFILFSEHGGKTFPIPPEIYFSQFLNTSQILLGRDETDTDLFLLDPESGEVKPISIPKPHILENMCWAGGFKCLYRYSAYSPDLKYVFYIADNNNSNYLFDIASGNLVENNNGGNAFGQSLRFPDNPVWKLDSSVVTIFDSYNYYNINVDGEYTQLTHLENLLSYYSLRTGMWSANGRYLAFMPYIDGNMSLFIFDSYTNTLINTCLSEPLDGRHYHWPMSWSPIGDQLAVNIGGAGQMNPYGRGVFAYDEWYKTKIIDVEHQVIYEISDPLGSDQQILVGWLSWELP